MSGATSSNLTSPRAGVAGPDGSTATNMRDLPCWKGSLSLRIVNRARALGVEWRGGVEAPGDASLTCPPPAPAPTPKPAPARGPSRGDSMARRARHQPQARHSAAKRGKDTIKCVVLNYRRASRLLRRQSGDVMEKRNRAPATFRDRLDKCSLDSSACLP